MYMPRFNADVQKPNPKEEAPMNTAVATTNRNRLSSENPERPQQPQQPQGVREVIAANVKCLIEQLEAGHSDALTGDIRGSTPT